MNIVDAYRISMGPGPVRHRRNMGALQVTYELLRTMLELPDGINVVGIYPNPMSNCLNIMLDSDTPMDGITTEIAEGMVVPTVDPERFIRFIERGNSVRPEVGYRQPEPTPDDPYRI